MRVHPGEATPVPDNNSSPYAGPSDAMVLAGIVAAIALAVYLFSTAPERRV